MQSSRFSSLMMRLLPRGDCWVFEKSSLFAQIVQGLACEFGRVYDRLNELTQAFYPKTSTSAWKDSLLFEPYSQVFYTLSLASVQAQFKYYNIRNVELIAPIEEPFMLYLHIDPVNEHYFAAGDEVGSELHHWRDEKLEADLSDIVPAFCKSNLIYRSSNA